MLGGKSAENATLPPSDAGGARDSAGNGLCPAAGSSGRRPTDLFYPKFVQMVAAAGRERARAARRATAPPPPKKRAGPSQGRLGASGGGGAAMRYVAREVSARQMNAR